MKTIPIERSLAHRFPEVAAQWHPTKNGDLRPENVSYGSHIKAWWICDKGHKWEALAKSRTVGKGCPYCAGQRVSSDNNLQACFPEIAEQWHPTLNGKLRPEDVTSASGRNVWWTCGAHKWRAMVCNRTAGHQCPYCVGIKASSTNNLQVRFPLLAAEWSKNNSLTPTEVMPKSNRKVLWVCDAGHEYLASIAHRANGCGCPICGGSKGERAVIKALEASSIVPQRQFPYKRSKKRPLRFDFAIAVGASRGLIEYQGKQHYEVVDFFGGDAALRDNQKRDHEKRELCRTMNIPLLEIPYWDYDRIPELVTSFVKELETKKPQASRA